jgi:glycosyltransferase involved in cell wall biosynthesis
LPTISVIIPHYNDVANLDRCLDLLARQSLDPTQYEIIVADNNSAIGIERLKEIVGRRATVVLAEEQGAGPARNKGVMASSGELIAFIDSDCRPSVGWLKAGCDALKEHDIAGGPYIIVPEDPNNITAVEAWDIVFGYDAYAFLTKKRFIGTGNLFVRRRVFEDVGPFRSVVSEDVEWKHRAISKVYSLHWAPDALLWHPARRDGQQLAKKWQRHTRETYYLVREQRFGLLKWIFLSWALPFSSIPHTALVMRSGSLTTWRQKADAIAILFRIRWYRFVESHRMLFSGHPTPS